MGGNWTKEDMPDMSGKKVVVTGANSGLGFEATRGFAEKNAEVVMACRSMERGRNALEEIEKEFPEASLELMELDLADLDSVEKFAEEYRTRYDELHVLCNNAGVMAIPRRETKDGFEMQFGVNHLGHFALTAHLIDLLQQTPSQSRVINMSSGVHRSGSIDFGDINHEEDYGKWRAYGQSKLANILFTKELEKRLEDRSVKAVATYPGWCATNLQKRGPEMTGSKVRKFLMEASNTLFGQSPEIGALTMLYAATSDEIEGGEYIGVNGFTRIRGYPEEQKPSKKARDEETAKRLWEVSEELTGVEFRLEEREKREVEAERK